MMESTNPYLPHDRDEAIDKIDQLTAWFGTLPSPVSLETLEDRYSFLKGRLRMLNSRGIQKYLWYADRFQYRMIDGKTAYHSQILPEAVRRFLTDEDMALVIPSYTSSGKVYRVTFRSVFTKSFRYYTPTPHIPHGFLRKNKPFGCPWIVVESAFDSDWLSTMYPYVLATGGVSGLNREGVDMVSNTAHQVFVAFDNDSSGRNGFYNLKGKLSKSNHELCIQMMMSPYGKDFGDVAQLEMEPDKVFEVEMYKNMVLNEFARLGLC